MKKQIKRKHSYLIASLLALCIIYLFFLNTDVVKAENVEDTLFESKNNLESEDLSSDSVEEMTSDNSMEEFSNTLSNEVAVEENENLLDKTEEETSESSETSNIEETNIPDETPSDKNDLDSIESGNVSEQTTEPINIEETLYVQTASLAVRPAKNSTELLGLLAKGTKINGYREGVWIRITYNGQTGYIAAKFTDKTPPPEPKTLAETLYVQTRSLAVRPAKNSTVLLGLLTRGTEIRGYREGAWIRITYNGQTAYVAAKFTASTRPLVLETFYTVSNVPVRPYKEAQTSLGILPSGTLHKGYREGGWTRITYQGKEAFIATRLTTRAGLGLVLDISSWQDPALMDFDLISRQISGAIMRIGVTDQVTGNGYYKDRHFEKFYKEFTNRNIPVGGYWYSVAANRQEGIGEANEVLKHIQNKKFKLPIFWDTENDKFQKDVPAKLLTDAGVGFITTLEAQGICSGIYGSAWWLNNKIEMERLKNYPVWVANYKTNYPLYNGKYDLWQFTDEARLAGFPYNLDLSIMYTDLPKMVNSIGPGTYYVQVSSLAVRPAKNSNVLLGRLTRGTKVSGIREGAWTKITYNGKTAYIATKFIDTAPPVAGTFYIKSSSLAVRPAKNSNVLLGRLSRGTKVSGIREGAWTRITYNGRTAYIAAKFTDTKPPAPGTYYVQVSSLAVRPAKNSNVLLGRLTRGTKVSGIREGAWTRITYNGRTAYVASKFISSNTP